MVYNRGVDGPSLHPLKCMLRKKEKGVEEKKCPGLGSRKVRLLRMWVHRRV